MTRSRKLPEGRYSAPELLHLRDDWADGRYLRPRECRAVGCRAIRVSAAVALDFPVGFEMDCGGDHLIHRLDEDEFHVSTHILRNSNQLAAILLGEYQAIDAVTVRGNPAKDPNSRELFPGVIKRGDRVLFAMQDAMKKLYDPATAAKLTVVAKNLSGTWETVISMQAMRQFGNPNSSKLTPAGEEALKRSDEKTGPASHCIPAPAPLWMAMPDLKRITVANRAITIEGEYDGGRRTVHMDVDTHDGAIPSFQGHSIGRWEGKTLIVDTTHFAYHGMGHGGGNGIAPNLPSSTQKHLVERFTLSDDSKSLRYQYELTDPVFLATARTGSVEWVFSPNAKFEVAKCSLENARRFIKG